MRTIGSSPVPTFESAMDKIRQDNPTRTNGWPIIDPVKQFKTKPTKYNKPF